MRRKEMFAITGHNHASCISPKRGMVHRAKRKTAKTVRQCLNADLRLRLNDDSTGGQL